MTFSDSDIKIENCDIYVPLQQNCLECKSEYILQIEDKSQLQKCVFKEEKDYMCQAKNSIHCVQCYHYAYMDFYFKCHLRTEYIHYLYVFIGVFGFIFIMALAMCYYKHRKKKRARAKLRANLLV